MMRKVHHSHSKPPAGQSNLLAAAWHGALQLSPISISHLTGGPGSRFSDCYLFLLNFREFAGGSHEQYVTDGHKGGGLLQITA